MVRFRFPRVLRLPASERSEEGGISGVVHELHAGLPECCTTAGEDLAARAVVCGF